QQQHHHHLQLQYQPIIVNKIMDSNLSLAICSNISSSPRTPLADDSISLPISSNSRDPSVSSPMPPLQFLEPNSNDSVVENGEVEESNGGELNEEEEEEEEEEFSLLGHPMCLKRRKMDGDSSSSSTTTTNKRCMMTMESLESRRSAVRAWSNQPLCIADPVIHEIMEKEKHRQVKGIELIASENFVCRAVMEALGSHLTNKYSEGMPGASRTRGTSANFAVYNGLLLPKDRIMGLDTLSGGHLSHGYYMGENTALVYRPKILICGGSSYPREWDYARFRQIADKCGAVLMCDMAHISGLVAAKACISPFDYCDVVTSTTHKSLRGPRGGIVFYRKGLKPRKRGTLSSHGDEYDRYDFEERINFAVFPSLQGGPHNNHIAALAIALKQVAAPEYHAYMQQVKKNAQALACALLRRKCRLVTGGTDNHLVLWDLRNFGLTGKNYEKVCEICYITLNKSAIFGDNGAIGVRIGTPAMTSRGCLEADFETIADFLLRVAQIACVVQREHGNLQKDFLKGLQANKDVVDLRNRVESFASLFAMPAFDV
ncbi:hypothetical protein IFM89_009835, partial [Coptis chinensis]